MPCGATSVPRFSVPSGWLSVPIGGSVVVVGSGTGVVVGGSLGAGLVDVDGSVGTVGVVGVGGSDVGVVGSGVVTGGSGGGVTPVEVELGDLGPGVRRRDAGLR